MPGDTFSTWLHPEERTLTVQHAGCMLHLLTLPYPVPHETAAHIQPRLRDYVEQTPCSNQLNRYGAPDTEHVPKTIKTEQANAV
jgi:hypothetical protein